MGTTRMSTSMSTSTSARNSSRRRGMQTAEGAPAEEAPVPAGEVASEIVEYRRVSHPTLARIQALQTELQAVEARVRVEQLQLIAADTGADLTHETWLIDLQMGLLARHEVVQDAQVVGGSD